ncbi:hypothetical protein LTR49_003189 [Elasticomyces elasticus]|nr:hypothetical protein LTR49_003189 [Elasticomyces elasticus]KAK5752493.1 hypothetical protein LTS12_017430 [Elasticomyces elasticus]
MKVLITGAGGFVGQLLAEHLLNEGHTLVLADIFEPPVPAKAQNKDNATCTKADLSEDSSSVLSKDLDAIYVFHGIMSAGSEENMDLGYKMPSEATVPTPEGSYGTQKVMIEYAINDYNRRGLLNAFIFRFPTISVRPGKPTAAASSWMSGIIREPLQGKESTLPCNDDFESWLCSPKTLVKNLIIALSLPKDCMEPHIRQVNLPGITATVKEMLQALREVGGEDAVKLIKREKGSKEVMSLLESWGVRYDVSKALKLGFVADQGFKGAVEDFAASLKEQ